MNCGKSAWLVSLIQRSNADSEDGDPCLGRQARGWVCDTAPAQRAGERRGE
jgi:hypothetical protein